jgi:hypothetical protein
VLVSTELRAPQLIVQGDLLEQLHTLAETHGVPVEEELRQAVESRSGV